MRTLKLLFVCMAVFFGATVLASNATTKSLPKFLALSDIHLDPYASCDHYSIFRCKLILKLMRTDYHKWDKVFEKKSIHAFTHYGHDANYFLFQSFLNELAAVRKHEHPQFVVVLGDLMPHSNREKFIYHSHRITRQAFRQFAQKQMAYIAYKLQQIFPDTPIYQAVGNNDHYLRNYFPRPDGRFFKDTANTWSGLLMNQDNKKHLLSEFPHQGYYIARLPSDNNTSIIMLNSIFFSKKAAGKNIDKRSEHQLHWLKLQLHEAKAKHRKVMIGFHVPPGINAYKNSQKKDVKLFWRRNINREFLNLLDEYSDAVVAVLSGHLHTDGFQLLNAKTPNLFIPSISPNIGNNPGFKIFSYQTKPFKLTDYSVRYLDLNNPSRGWQTEYYFNATYQPKCKNCSITSGIQKLKPKGTLSEKYIEFYTVNRANAQPISRGKWLPYYWCTIHNALKPPYTRCLSNTS